MSDRKPKAYMYAEVTVRDPDYFFSKYVDQAVRMIENDGGRFLVLGGEPEVIEGDRQVTRAVIIEFRDYDHLKTFYESDAYQELTKHRLVSADTHLYFLKGVHSSGQK